MEILIATPAVRALISESKINQLYSSMQSGQAESGMQTMNQALSNLLRNRFITKETALASSTDQQELLDLLINQNNMRGRRN